MALHAVKPDEQSYEFTNAWFEQHEQAWGDLLGSLKPRWVLEIGCYEGRASTFLIENMVDGGSLTCVDTWAGGADLPPHRLDGVEQRFDRNTALALGSRARPITFHKRNQSSFVALCDLAVTGKRFDLIYIDASHTAPDVLTDAVLAFRLLTVGGVMIFDDYTWYMEPQGEQDPLNMPKPAVDAFVNLFIRKLAFSAFGAKNLQLAVQKKAD